MATPVVPATPLVPTTPASPATKPTFVMPDLKPCSHPIQGPCIDAFNHEILIKVGKEGKEVRIYEGLLTYHSSYFAAALSGSFIEGQTKVIELKEDEVEVFSAFHCWIYTGRLHPSRESPLSRDAYKAPTSSERNDLYLLLAKIFVFGDMRGIPALKNEAIDILHQLYTCTWTDFHLSAVKYIYKNTTATSQLRQFVAHANVIGLRDLKSFHETTSTAWPIAYVFDVLQLVAMKDRSGAWPKLTGNRMHWAKLDRCQFHDHSGPGGALRKTPAIG
ncbi:hypothetical protein BU16DRAFT_61435 [Lophium mytilinum]|uniref:BTB domain-containing protein n=1 Tax=Lophium mytilinum TaxID=390894 RepID=A0A6A6QNL6_9PEZI|nr:hypothetical protein BU16DRAFT_61435 [Lophium mytilinum]